VLRPLLRLSGLVLLAVPMLLLASGARAVRTLGAQRAGLRLAARIQGLWARAVLRILGVELVLHGTPPNAAGIVVANHLSYLDIPVLAAVAPGRFVAKREIAGWPVLGQLAAAAGTIFVEQRRARDVLRVDEEMAQTLAASVPVLIFPEGHSTRGERVERLHSSLFERAVREGIPCQAVTLHYETPDDRWAPAATVCWWGGMGFWRHAFGLAALRRVRADVRVCAAARRAGDRKELAARLHADLVAGFPGVRQEPIAPDCPWGELFGGASGASPSRP
jgi:1-acyl-sn-glycerol-3-phosphate acyltransferase